MFEDEEGCKATERACGTADSTNPAYRGAAEPPLLFDASMESANLLKAVQVRFATMLLRGVQRQAVNHFVVPQVGPCEYDLILRPDINTTGFTQWFYFAVANTHPGSRRPRVCGLCGKRKTRCRGSLPQYDKVDRRQEAHHRFPGSLGGAGFGGAAHTDAVDAGVGVEAAGSGSSGDDGEDAPAAATMHTLVLDPAAGAPGQSQLSIEVAGRGQHRPGANDAVGAHDTTREIPRAGARAGAATEALADAEDDDKEVDENSDVSSEDDSIPSSDDEDEDGKRQASAPIALVVTSPKNDADGPPVPSPKRQPSWRSLKSGEKPTSLFFCPAEHEFTFNIINLRKNGSLFNEGMLPVVYSVRTARETGVGWVRTGTNVKYAENEHIKGRRRRRRKAKRYSSLTFTLKFPHAGDVSLIAISYPYVAQPSTSMPTGHG